MITGRHSSCAVINKTLIITSNSEEVQMEKHPIDNKATCDAIRNSQYGSVLAFCRATQLSPPFFYLIVSGQRGEGKRGPTSIIANGIINRLEDEGLLVRAEGKNS